METLARNCLQAWSIAKVNLRHNFLPHLALSVFVLILTPVLFGLSGLDRQASAVPLEIYVSLIGMILLTPIFQPELNPRIGEVISSKYVSRTFVYTIRTLYSGFVLLSLISLFILYMRLNNCQVSLSLLFGTFASAVFLGSLGMLSSVMTKNIAVSYMIPVGYYAMNLAGGLRLGHFDLFSMMDGQYEQKVWLLASSAIMMASSVIADRYLR